MKYEFVDSCQIDHEKLNQIYLDTFGYKEKGYFCEVGAYDGKTFSNTYELSILGWHGLYIEPVPYLMLQCQKNHAFNPYIKYFDKPIGKEYKPCVPFYIGDWASTLCEDVVKANPHLNRNNFITTDVYPLDYVLLGKMIPYNFDLLVVDTEGNDLEVMEGFSINLYNPNLVIIEYNQNRFEDFQNYFTMHNYKLILRDTINLIYVRGY